MLHPNVYLIFRKKFFFIDSHATTKQQKIVTGFYDHGKIGLKERYVVRRSYVHKL